MRKRVPAGICYFLMALLCGLLLPHLPVRAQLTVAGGYQIEDLVRKYFAGGCAAVSNVVFTGHTDAIGYFNGSNSNIGINEGILLCSGRISIAPGPNTLPNAGYNNNNSGDQDLSDLINAPTYDAAILEFDFVSFRDTVGFEYVFASEEYEEYVGSAFNDVFAFFISGPGIVGQKNIALIPGTATPVSINSVNHITNSQYYINNDFGMTVQYDGFTKVLRAKLSVIPCTTYHMKIAIADVSDYIYDSGVFLKSGSFNEGASVTLSIERETAEGACLPGLIRFTRTGPRTNSLTIQYKIGGSATNGIDYVTLPGSITIPAGQEYVDLPIQAISDGIPDPGEVLILSIDNICSCLPNSAEMHIDETLPLTASLDRDTTLCLGTSLTLTGLGKGGSTQYRYEWSHGLGNDSIVSFTPTVTSDIIFTVTDTVYGCVARDTMRVVVHTLPKANAGPDVIVCPQSSVIIGLPASGGSTPYRYRWDPPEGLNNPGLERPTANPRWTTTYVVTVTSADGCTDRDTVTVTVSDLIADAGPDRVLCYGSSTQLGNYVDNGSPPYSYKWTPAAGLSSTTVQFPLATPAFTTKYVLTVKDAAGCVITDTVTVEVVPIPKLEIKPGGPFTICEGDSLILDAGEGHTSYRWSTGDTTRMTVVTIRGTYTVVVSNEAGCEATESILILAKAKPFPVVTPSGKVTRCEGDSLLLRITDSFQSYRWSTGDTTDHIIIRASGSYSVRVTNDQGCEGVSETVDVLFSQYPKTEITGPRSVCTGTIAEYSIQPPGSYSVLWNVAGGTLLSLPTDQSIRILWESPGTGTISVAVTTDAGDCRVDSVITVSVGTILQPKISASRTVLCAGDTVLLDAGPGYTSYQWSGGERTRQILVRNSGMYRVIVKDQVGCIGSDSIAITVLPKPVPVIVPSGPLTLCDGDSLLLDAGDGYADYLWSNGAISRFMVVRTTGLYTVSVRDSSGCRGESLPVDVRAFPPPAAQIEGPRSLCTNSRASYRVAPITGGNYRWTVNNGTILSGDGTDSIVVQWGSMSGTIALTLISSVTSCSTTVTDSVILGTSLAPVISILGPAQPCEGDSTILDAGAGYASYRWNTGETGRRIVVRTGGVFTVTVTDNAGCSGTSTPTEIRFNAKPAPSIAGPSSVCVNSTVTYSAPVLANHQYDWQSANGTIISGNGTAVISILWASQGSGSVSLRVTNEGTSCSAETTITVTVSATLRPIVTASGATTFCEGDSVILDAGQGYDTYAWDNGESTRTIVVGRSGTYRVTVTDLNGCSGTSDAVVVTVHTAPRPRITAGGPTTFCFGDSVVLAAPPGFSSYAWNSGSTGRFIVVRNGGIHVVTVTDSNGCAGKSDSVAVIVHPIPVVSILRDNINLSASTTAPVDSYQWYLDDTPIAGATSKDHIASQNGSYHVVIVDTNGCVGMSRPISIEEEISTLISVPVIEAAPGERVMIPLLLQDARNLASGTSADFTATLRLHKNILVPAGATPPGTIQRDFRLIQVGGSHTGRTGPLSIFGKPGLEFVAVLGDVESTPIYIDQFTWIDGRIATTTMNGEFQLKICREGGARLIRTEGTLSLMQNRPNPFNATTMIEYEIIEKGRTRLLVMDMLGKQVATIVDSDLEPGRYELAYDASILMSGTYFYVLVTPTRVLHRMMHVVK